MSMNPQELRVFERIATNLGKINDSIADLTDVIKKTSSNTNRTTMLYKIVESLDGVSESVDQLKEAQTKSAESIKSQIARTQ